MKLSLVVPCYNEEGNIHAFYTEAKRVFDAEDYDYEFIFINDGSKDKTQEELEKVYHLREVNVVIEMFSRNFGKEAGLYAGLEAATGDYVVVMDADLQDPPEYLPEMYQEISSGEYDCVGMRRTDRKGEAKFKSFLSNQFYNVINKISDTKIVPGARDYRMMTRQMVDAVLSLKEYNRFSKGIFNWVGFKTKYLPYKNVERVAGTTDWSTWKLFKYAIDGITDFSEAPLSMATWIGGFSAFAAAIGIIAVIVRHFVAPSGSAFGWASLVCIMLFIGGVQLFCLGIVGRYIGKIYMQAKKRPIYIVKEKK